MRPRLDVTMSFEIDPAEYKRFREFVSEHAFMIERDCNGELVYCAIEINDCRYLLDIVKTAVSK
jgi:hypothetical protein